jgi:hypothetical protein
MRKYQPRPVAAIGLQDDLLILSTKRSLLRENRCKPPWHDVFTGQRTPAAEDTTSRHVDTKSFVKELDGGPSICSAIHFALIGALFPMLGHCTTCCRLLTDYRRLRLTDLSGDVMRSSSVA